MKFMSGKFSSDQGNDTVIFVLGIALVFVYFVLVVQFNSFRQSFIVMIAVPLSFIVNETSVA